MIFVGILIGLFFGVAFSFAFMLYTSKGDILITKDKEDDEAYFNIAFKSKEDMSDMASSKATFVIFKLKRF